MNALYDLFTAHPWILTIIAGFIGLFGATVLGFCMYVVLNSAIDKWQGFTRRNTLKPMATRMTRDDLMARRLAKFCAQRANTLRVANRK
jgi:hypothetical protein